MLKNRIPNHEFKHLEGLLRSAIALREWYKLLANCGPAPDQATCQKALALAKKHNALFKQHAGFGLKPKNHAFYEMNRQMPKTGNPVWFATFLDETLNSMIARLSRSVHPRHFSLEVLKKYFLGRHLRKLPY